MILQRYPIVYYPIPKVACTSIKLALYELDHGVQFETRQSQDGTWIDIHSSWEGTPGFEPVSDSERYHKFVVVRDPIQRFLSSYANRVIYHGELHERHLCNIKKELIGLKANPSLSEFIHQLPLYREASKSIRHHTDPQTYFIGRDLSYYDKIFLFTSLHQIVETLKDLSGIDITLPYEQNGGPKFTLADVGKNERKIITDFYEEDYRLLEEFYHPVLCM